MTDTNVQPPAVSPQPEPPTLLDAMKVAPIWLLWKTIAEPGKVKPRKVPFYINGTARAEILDSPEDRAQLTCYEAALAALDRSGGAYAGLGIALGPDGNGGQWQGIDLDEIVANSLTDIAELWTREGCAGLGYVEASPGGAGIHILGYGRPFRSLGSNVSGIEAYAGKRFFTFSGRPIVGDSPCRIFDLAAYTEQALAPRHGAARPAAANGMEVVLVTAETVADLRSALAHMRADDYDIWYRMGLALKELGDTGRGLWLSWSATSTKYDPRKAALKWDSFEPRDTGYKAVFAEAARHGWSNPGNATGRASIGGVDISGLLPPAEPSRFTLEFAMPTDTATTTLEYLLDPWLPARCVVGFFGRGSTAKSSFLASMAAHISATASTLWISVEEPSDWIRVRHLGAGGAAKTLAVVKAIESKRDKEGRVVASSFNVLQDLEPVIEQAKVDFARQQLPSLRLVVLDTAVGLTHWGKGESPNDDAAVKKLLAHLQSWADRHNLTIAIIGHANKGTHDHLADTVMGATAWTNSPRLSFVHAEDRREDFTYVVRTAKTNFEAFGAPYRTEAIHTLYERSDGPDTVLVKVIPGDPVWGSLDSMEMFREATKKPRDGDEDGDGAPARAPTLRDAAIQALEELLTPLAPGEFVTREQVQQRLAKNIDRARWKTVEDFLGLHPIIFVDRDKDNKNRAIYRRKA